MDSMRVVDPMNDHWAIKPKTHVDARRMFSEPLAKIATSAAVHMEVGNSEVGTTGPVDVTDILHGLFASVRLEELKISINHIKIDGPMPDEPLHFHLGNILVLVTAGEGYLRYSDGHADKDGAVKKGDIVAIPSGALHSFTCDVGQIAEYAVLEIGPDIDYQAHHYI